MKLVTITERIQTNTPKRHLINDDLDKLVRTELGLDEYDTYEIHKMSQSTIDESTESNHQALLVISLLIKVNEN